MFFENWDCLFGALVNSTVSTHQSVYSRSVKTGLIPFGEVPSGAGGRLRNAVATSVLFGVYASPNGQAVSLCFLLIFRVKQSF